jgi:NADH-quinone oxidoreductase subunit H
VLFLLALSGTAIAGGSWSLAEIRNTQLASGSYFLPQIVGFFLAVSGLIGKLKREPYDIPNAKSEMIEGPLTEYSGRKLGLWHLTIQLQTMVGLSFLVHVYFAGYWEMGTISGFFIFCLLLILLQCLLSVISAIYTRLRIDQLIHLNWYILIPLALLHNLYLILK